MFTNLIESSSHASEFRRRGSFFLFTTVTYFLLFAIAGLASIYAYDARLEDQNTEVLVMLSPVDLPAPAVAPAHAAAPPRGHITRTDLPQRAIRMSTVDTPQVVPERTSSEPNKYLPPPRTGDYLVTGRDVDPIGPPNGSGNGGSGVAGINRTPAIEVGTPPPLPPVEKPKPQIIRKSTLLNGEALSLPKPPYPPIAKQLRIQGPVNVQVVISEAGKVISAKAVSGNPALVSAAQQAALQARFSPTTLGEQPVKVSGIITYNFVLQ
jgi:periplasmic protein TonB